MYLRKIWFLPLLLAVSIESSPSPQPPYNYQSTARTVPAVVPQVVYTADRIRNEPQQDRLRDSDLFPSTATTGTARTTHGGADDNSEEPENTGFVEPIDFGSFLSGVGNHDDKQNLASGSSNPFVTAESKDAFAGFFNSNNKDAFVEPNFGSISTASSNQNSQKHDEDEVGFVDPNVQFRSLFDSTQTGNGFRPQDFLNSKDDSTGVDPSKGSQTRAFPSFTYSGRQNNDDGYVASSDPKYRSSYRQVGAQDYDDSREQRPSRDPYDDRNYYNGERDRSPPPPQNPRYNQGPPPQASPQRAQATAHTPKVASKTSDSNGSPRCKKVEKQVDTSDDYQSYTDPEPDYDPATYGSRYKRQARGGNRNGGGKKPMTCYVCEDEQGRYAERCSYDSKADPGKKGNYYHSTSSSYNDQGRRPQGGRERPRRNPSLKAAASATLATTVPTVSTTTQEGPLEEPKRLEKRQSDRYAPNHGHNRDSGRGRNDNDGFRGFDVPNSGGHRLGSQPGNRNEGFDDDVERDEYGAPREAGSSGRGRSNNNRAREDDFGTGDFGNSPSARESAGDFDAPQGRDNGGGPSALETEYGNGRPDNRRQDENYGFVDPLRQGSSRGGGGGGRNTEFDFGPPSDFGRDTSASNTNNQGFNFDFTIPREFDPDVQLRTSNSHPSPNLQSSPINSGGGGGGNNFGNFDSGYDDYVKKYFPGAFEIGSSTPSSSPSSSSFRPSHGPPSHSPPSHRVPDREHTQQSNQYSPAPYFQHEGNGEHLEKLVGAFSSRDRNGCEKIVKGDMTCYVCSDPRGMKKEECMYASNDPRNKQMAYHEVTEYSSLPPASILPRPELASAASSPLVSSTPPSSAGSSFSHSHSSLSPSPSTSSSHSHITKESRIIETKVKKSPVDYDFDY